MYRIDEPDKYVITKFDGVSAATVYRGGFDYMTREEDLVWEKTVAESGDVFDTLTLAQIAKQVDSSLITIFVEDPFAGTILQYGNYGDSWWEIGKTSGYA